MNIKGLIASVALLGSLQVLANEVITNVVSVVDSGRTDRILVLSSVDGRVYRIARDKETRDYLKSLVGQNVHIAFDLINDEAMIRTITPAGAVSQDVNLFANDPNRPEAEGTDVGTIERATQIFKSLNSADKDHSQCFKRAHMWAFDTWSKMGVTMSKQFIFYTDRFMQLNDFKWWFHVAPTVLVSGVDYVIDGGFDFITTPLKTDDWKSKVSPQLKNITCPVIGHYDEYDKNRWSRLCYFRKMPMHYFRPLDILNHDRNGVVKTGWDLSELQDARRAFGNGKDTYEALDTGRSTITH